MLTTVVTMYCDSNVRQALRYVRGLVFLISSASCNNLEKRTSSWLTNLRCRALHGVPYVGTSGKGQRIWIPVFNIEVARSFTVGSQARDSHWSSRRTKALPQSQLMPAWPFLEVGQTLEVSRGISCAASGWGGRPSVLAEMEAQRLLWGSGVVLLVLGPASSSYSACCMSS